MRTELVEWILSQVTPPEQARTIVGDLLEAQLAPVQFWLAVVLSMLSIARHQPARILRRLLLWLHESSLYIFLAWTSTHFPKHALNQFAFQVIAIFAVWLAMGWVLGWRRGNVSQLPMALFWAYMFVHDGMPVWVAVLIPGSAAVFGWWMEWRRQQKNALQEDNRPVAG